MVESILPGGSESAIYTKQLAERFGFGCEIFYHETSGRTTEDAERALGLGKEYIIKCLLLKSKNDMYIGAVLRGSDRLNFKEIESIAGYKGLRMAQEDDVVRKLGFKIGGVPVIIFKEKGVETYVDNHVMMMDYVVGSGGTVNHGMRFKPLQLTSVLSYKRANIIKEEK